MRVNPPRSKKPTAHAVPEKSEEQTWDKHDVQPGRAIDCIVPPRPLSKDMASNDGRGYEETTQDKEHDDCLVAEPSEKIEGFERPGSVCQMPEVHEKKRPQMTDHHGASRNRAEHVEGIERGNGTFEWNPCQDSRLRQT